MRVFTALLQVSSSPDRTSGVGSRRDSGSNFKGDSAALSNGINGGFWHGCASEELAYSPEKGSHNPFVIPINTSVDKAAHFRNHISHNRI